MAKVAQTFFCRGQWWVKIHGKKTRLTEKGKRVNKTDKAEKDAAFKQYHILMADQQNVKDDTKLGTLVSMFLTWSERNSENLVAFCHNGQGGLYWG